MVLGVKYVTVAEPSVIKLPEWSHIYQLVPELSEYPITASVSVTLRSFQERSTVVEVMVPAVRPVGVTTVAGACVNVPTVRVSEKAELPDPNVTVATLNLYNFPETRPVTVLQ